MKGKELKEFLDFKSTQYENIDFITYDPIKIPHQYQRKEDIEICAFITATIAWGNRLSIIKSGQKLNDIWGDSPFEFIMEYRPENKIHFVHRTFNSLDFDFFCRSLKSIYKNGGLEKAFKIIDTFLNTQFEGGRHQRRVDKIAAC